MNTDIILFWAQHFSRPIVKNKYERLAEVLHDKIKELRRRRREVRA